MAYPQTTLRLVFGGTMGADIWRTGLNLGCAAAPGVSDADMNSIAADALVLFEALWDADLKSKNASGVRFTQVDSYLYTGGTSVAAHVGQALQTGEPGTGSGILPFRTACVVSLKTDFAGRKNRGRAYLPFTAGGSLTAAGGQFSGVTSTLATAYKTFLDGLNASDWTAEGITEQALIITSPTATSEGQIITSFSINTVPDSQRRRTNKDLPDSVVTRTLALV